VPQGTGI